MRDRQIGTAPNYTNAALVMGLINLFCLFAVVWAAMGLMAVLIIAVFIDYLITRLARSRA